MLARPVGERETRAVEFSRAAIPRFRLPEERLGLGGRITVVMLRRRRRHDAGGHLTSMGPRSDNRGYVLHLGRNHRHLPLGLQWVHGRITVVMEGPPRTPDGYRDTSMGPRSDNRGYASRLGRNLATAKNFNGSTVG